MDQVIAVVDDEPSVRTMLGRLLRLADYQVAAYDSGEAFLASLAASRPACALVDLRMSGLSGFEVQSRLRETQPRIPVVLMTANDEPELDRSALEAGAVCLLRKPFTSNELLAALGAALGPAGGHLTKD